MSFSTGIDHVCIIAKDMESSIDFYTRILGFELTKRETLPPAGVEVAVVTLKSANIELVKFLDDREYHDGDGLIELVGLNVEDINAAAEHLKNNGVELLGEPTILGPKDAFLFFRGPSGERLELVMKSAG